MSSSIKQVAELLRAECADVQRAMLELSTDARERGMLPDAEKIRRMNDRAIELHEAANTLDALRVGDAGPTAIRDEEGNLMLTVPDALTQDSVAVVLSGLERAFKRGTACGKELRSIELRQLLGAAPITES